MFNRNKFSIPSVFFSLIVVLLINSVTAIDYSHRQDEMPQNVTKSDARTTRQILELTTKIDKLKEKYTLQEGTEHLLQFGALLRTQILDTFGYLVYDRYDDYSVTQMEALYSIYHETLERKYNIFDIVPSILKSADIRPSKVCRYINENVHTCLKENSHLCMNIRKHNKRRLISLNHTPEIYQLAEIQKHFPDGFSLKNILQHLQNDSLKFTSSLLSGLLHNIQYDSFDDEVRTAERELIRFLTKSSMTSKISKNSTLMTSEEMKDQKSVSQLLRTYLKKASAEFKSPANFHAEILAEHVVREVEAISENIELIGTVYENNTIHLKYLFDLILPPDVLDTDLIEAKEYLLKKTEDLQLVSKHLRIEKYQQAGPDQLLMEILGQMRDIHFAVDIVSALHIHARFWHRSRAIEDIDELLELFSAYENLRNVEEFSDLMEDIDKIRDRLSESKNVSIEITCSSPRACLQIGLQIVKQCTYVNEDTKNLIDKFFVKVTSKGSPTKEECPPMDAPPTECGTGSPEITTEHDESPDTTRKPETKLPTILKDEGEDESKISTLADNPEPPQSPELSTTIGLEDADERTIPADSMGIESKLPTESSIEEISTSLPVSEEISPTIEEATTTEEDPNTKDTIIEEATTTTEEVVTITEGILADEKDTTSEEVTTIETITISEGVSASTEKSLNPSKNVFKTIEKMTSTTEITTKNSPDTESTRSECSSSEDCSSECTDENCSNSEENCSPGGCETEKPCEGDDCQIKTCSGQNCTAEFHNDKNVTCDGENCSREIGERQSGCEGKDCPKKEGTECGGSDCSGKDDKNPLIDNEEKTNCEGSGCLEKNESDKSLKENEGKTDCKGSECPNEEKEPPCSGPKCPGSDCEGKNCTTNFEERCQGNDCSEVLNNRKTVLCNSKDPHRQRRKERLQKMRQLDVLSLTTSKIEEIESEATTTKEDYSSIDEAKTTEVKEERIEEVSQKESVKKNLSKEKKTKIERHSVDEKKPVLPHDDIEGRNERKTEVKNHIVDKKKPAAVRDHIKEAKGRVKEDKSDLKKVKLNMKHELKGSRKTKGEKKARPGKVTSDNSSLDKKAKQIEEKKNLKMKKYPLVPKENVSIKKNPRSDSVSRKEKEKTSQMEKLRKNKLAKLKPVKNENLLKNGNSSIRKDSLKNADSIEADSEGEVLMDEDSVKEGDELENEDSLKDEDALEKANQSENEDSLRNSQESDHGKISYERSNHPADKEDIPFVYQTPKPELKTAGRLYIDDLLKKFNDVKPGNRMFDERIYNKGSDEIERNREILNPMKQKKNFQVDLLDDEGLFYDEADNLPESRTEWPTWYQ